MIGNIESKWLRRIALVLFFPIALSILPFFMVWNVLTEACKNAKEFCIGVKEIW